MWTLECGWPCRGCEIEREGEREGREGGIITAIPVMFLYGLYTLMFETEPLTKQPE